MLTHMRNTLPLLALPIFLTGCQTTGSNEHMNSPEMAAFVELMMPETIEIQKFTQPISRAGDGKADAIEAIVAAKDAAGDHTKIVGTFQFELRRRRITSGPALDGDRLAYWRIPLTTFDECTEHWSRYSRFYRFPLGLEAETLPAGDYVLSAQYTAPTGKHYFDEFVIRFEGGPAPPLQPRY